MRVLFAGTPALAVPPLRALARAVGICGVLTNPDAPAGRGARLLPSAAKLAALELGLPVYQPARLDASFRAHVRDLGVDLLVVVAYGKIFRPEFLALFARGAVNMHPSLLPRHRGPTPIPATILAGDAVGGVTIQRAAAAVDTGAILARAEVPLDGTETTGTLSERLSPIGAELLVDVVARLENGTATEVEQEHDKATYCHKLAKADGLIDWGEEAATIGRKVRAFDPFPGTFTIYGERSLRILETAPVPPEFAPSPSVAGLASGSSMAPGVVLGTDNRYGILVSTGRGVLGVRRLQLEARKALDWRSFWNGVSGFAGAHLGGSSHATTVDATATHD